MGRDNPPGLMMSHGTTWKELETDMGWGCLLRLELQIGRAEEEMGLKTLQKAKIGGRKCL